MKKAKFLTPALITALVLFGISGIIYIISRLCTPFAEWWTRYPSQYMRAGLAFITNPLPFSLAEMVLILLLPAVILYLCLSNKYIKSDDTAGYYRCLRPLLMLVLILVSTFLGVFGPCYFRNGLEDNVGLDKANVTAEELKYTAQCVIEEINRLEITTDEKGAAVPQKGHDGIVKGVKSAFEDYCKDKKYISWFDSNPKLISLSPLMTYTHISGLYSFFTGEANINFNYPDFVFPFTLAHEMAHQRGIAREDEANFVAFMVCLNSEDHFIRYSGLFNMLEYLLSALSKADKTLYNELAKNDLTAEIKAELRAYSQFFEKYSDSPASQVAGSINNSYLTSQGQSAGSASYGLVVDLAVAYYKQK